MVLRARAARLAGAELVPDRFDAPERVEDAGSADRVAGLTVDACPRVLGVGALAPRVRDAVAPASTAWAAARRAMGTRNGEQLT